MKVPKEIVREAQLLAVNLRNGGVIHTDRELWHHAMLLIKTRYHAAKVRAFSYGFVLESRETADAVPSIHRVQSEGGSRRAESNVHQKSLARRAFAGRLLSALRHPQGVGSKT